MMKYLKLYLLILLTILLNIILISCGRVGDRMIIINSDVSILELINTKNAYNKVIDVLRTNPTIDTLNDMLGQQSYKKYEFGYYTVIDTDEELLIVYFDSEKKYEGCFSITFSDDLICEDIEDLSIGASLEKVRQLDPEGYYPFLYSGWSNYPRISYHYFSNGMVYMIQYDEFCLVSNVNRVVL